jgi:hypothetical protein
MLDGVPLQLLSGSVHYFRIPPEQWADRLAAVKAMGLNAIQVSGGEGAGCGGVGGGGGEGGGWCCLRRGHFCIGLGPEGLSSLVHHLRALLTVVTGLVEQRRALSAQRASDPVRVLCQCAVITADLMMWPTRSQQHA